VQLDEVQGISLKPITHKGFTSDFRIQTSDFCYRKLVLIDFGAVTDEGVAEEGTGSTRNIMLDEQES
jgi:hypothetical protein